MPLTSEQRELRKKFYQRLDPFEPLDPDMIELLKKQFNITEGNDAKNS